MFKRTLKAYKVEVIIPLRTVRGFYPARPAFYCGTAFLLGRNKTKRRGRAFGVVLRNAVKKYARTVDPCGSFVGKMQTLQESRKRRPSDACSIPTAIAGERRISCQCFFISSGKKFTSDRRHVLLDLHNSRFDDSYYIRGRSHHQSSREHGRRNHRRGGLAFRHSIQI